MKLKKIMSGLLSLALSAGLIPGGIVFAENETIRKEDCLFYEDFEGSTETKFDLTAAAQKSSYWHNEITEDSTGNKYMKYYINPSEEGKTGATTILDNRLGITLNKDNWYEIGYTCYPGTIRGNIQNLFSVGLTTDIKTPYAIFGTINNTNSQYMSRGAASKNSAGAVIVSMANMNNLNYVDGGVKIRVMTNPSSGATQITWDYIVKSTQQPVHGVQNCELKKTLSDSDVYIRTAMSYINFNVTPQNTDGYIGLDNVYIRQLPSYKVKLDMNDGTGTIVSELSVSPVSELVLPEPKRDGYQFDGWYAEPECETLFNKDNYSEDTTVYAKWLKIHTITFDTDGGTVIDPIKTIEDSIKLPPNPSKIRHEFGGWFTDDTFSEEFDGTGISGDMTIYAKWLYANEISFEPNGGDPIEPIYTVSGVEAVPNATRLGYRFDGWFTDEELTNKFDCTNVTEDVKVYAAWTRKHVVSFETNGGEPLEPIYTLEDIDNLPEAVKPGFGFEGWYRDKELTQIFDGINIAEDITVYAKYSNVLFHEDFENDNDNEWLKMAAPNKWEEWAGQGYGVVTDKKGNREYRLANEGGKYVDITFPNGGEGLYEIEFKIRCEGNAPVIQTLFTPMNGNKGVFGTQLNGGWIIPNGEHILLGKVGATAVNGYITLKWWVDTQNNLSSAIGQYTNKANITLTEEVYNKSFPNDVNGLTGIRLSTGGSSDALTNVYFDDISVRKIEQPSLENSMPINGQKDVELRPDIRLEFSRKIETKTVTTSNITITNEAGEAVSADDYTISEDEEDGKTVLTVKLKKDLEYATVYSVNLSTNLRDTLGYFMDNRYSVQFTTKPMRYEVTPTLVDEDGKEVGDISQLKGKKINAKLYLRNFAGGENDDVFVSAALVDEATNRQIAYAFEEIILAKNEGKIAIDAKFDVPEEATPNYKVHYYIWNNRGERKAMTDSCVLPQ